MSNKDLYQLDFFTLSFKKDFPDSLKPFALNIFEKLYLDNAGLNIKETHLLFNNSKIDLVRETIEKLYRDYNLIVLDKSKCKRTEKRYFITEFGRKVLLEQYNSNR